MSIGAANLFTRNVWKSYVNPNISHASEAAVAKIASLVVKVGALAFILFLPTQYALDLQLLGGLWILQTFPAPILWRANPCDRGRMNRVSPDERTSPSRCGLHSVNRPRPTAVRQGHTLGLHCAVEGVHRLVHALPSADFGDDRADDEKELRGIPRRKRWDRDGRKSA